MDYNPSPERYFPNPYPDFSLSTSATTTKGQQLINHHYLRNLALEYGFLCIANEKAKSTAKYCDGGIYTGNLGIIFMCYKLLKSGLISDPNQNEKILNYINDCVMANQEYYANNDIKQTRDVSFLCGKGGFYVMAAMSFKLLGNDSQAFQFAQAYAQLSRVCEPLQFLPRGSDEIFVGRAGFLWYLFFWTCYKQ